MKSLLKNKRGSIMLVILMSIIFFMFGMLIMSLIRNDATTARDAEHLNCQNVTVISDGNKMSCLIVDSSIPYFILVIISVAGGYIAERALV